MNAETFIGKLVAQGWSPVVNAAGDWSDIVGEQAGLTICGYFTPEDVLSSVNVVKDSNNFSLGATFEDWDAPDYSLAWAEGRLSGEGLMPCDDPYCRECIEGDWYDSFAAQDYDATYVIVQDKEPEPQYAKYDPEWY